MADSTEKLWFCYPEGSDRPLVVGQQVLTSGFSDGSEVTFAQCAMIGGDGDALFTIPLAAGIPHAMERVDAPESFTGPLQWCFTPKPPKKESATATE